MLVQLNGLVPMVAWMLNSVLLSAVMVLLVVLLVVNHHLLMAL